MHENVTQLAENVDTDKLLVEIVQGLLMAHVRLDRMEDSLRYAVEAASLKHLDKFDQKLRDVDTRFQTTAREVAQTTQNLEKVRTNLVQSVEAASRAHHQAFSAQVYDLHKSIDYLRDEGVTRLHNDVKDNRPVEARRFEELKTQGVALSHWQTVFGKAFDHSYQTSQAKLDKSFANVAVDVQLSTSTVTDKLESATSDIRNRTLEQAQANRRLLIWLICLSAISVLCLGAITFKLFAL